MSHQKTLAIVERDDRTGISGAEIFSPKVFDAFMHDHREFDQIYQDMQDDF